MGQLNPTLFCEEYKGKLLGMLDNLSWTDIVLAIDMIKRCKGTVWLIGNGGSAALASHMATDLQLAGVRAVALTDVAAITTHANDSNYEHSFINQIDLLMRTGDLLIAISGSGNSLNVVGAAEWAVIHGFSVIGLTGGTDTKLLGGVLGKVCNLHINVPATHMGVSQDGHQIVFHMIAYFLMQERKK